MKNLVGKTATKDVKFMDDSLQIRKLSIAAVMSIQELQKKNTGGETAESNIALLKLVVTKAVVGAEDLTDADFASFPLDDLSKLSNEILEFSGLGNVVAK